MDDRFRFEVNTGGMWRLGTYIRQKYSIQRLAMGVFLVAVEILYNLLKIYCHFHGLLVYGQLFVMRHQ